MLANCRDLLCRRDIPARRPGWIAVEPEVVAEIALFCRKAVSTAHERPLYQKGVGRFTSQPVVLDLDSNAALLIAGSGLSY